MNVLIADLTFIRRRTNALDAVATTCLNSKRLNENISIVWIATNSRETKNREKTENKRERSLYAKVVERTLATMGSALRVADLESMLEYGIARSAVSGAKIVSSVPIVVSMRRRRDAPSAPSVISPTPRE